MAANSAITVNVRRVMQNGGRILAAAGETAVAKSIGVSEYGGAQPYTEPSDEAIYSIVWLRDVARTKLMVEETVATITAAWIA